MNPIRFQKLQSFLITEKHVTKFASIVGDFNPVHTNPQFAAQTRFGKPIAHGMIGGGFIRSLIPTNLKLTQFQMKFKKPIFYNQNIKVEVIVYEDLTLQSIIRNEEDEKITEMTGTVQIREDGEGEKKTET